MGTEQLSGGFANAGQVVRDGDVVFRPLPHNVDTLHPLLEHLAAVGFEAPRPLGVDGGRERVAFIRGDVALSPFPGWSMSQAALVEVARMLRRFHDAVDGYVPAGGDVWSSELADPEGGPIICHNDACIENVVFRDQRAVALLDFDFAAPGRRVWDVAMTCRYWVPLTDPSLADEIGRPLFDPFARVAAFVDAYDLNVTDRSEFVDALFQTEEVGLRFVRDQIAAGKEQFATMLDAAGRARRDRKMRWLEANRDRLSEAITSPQRSSDRD